MDKTLGQWKKFSEGMSSIDQVSPLTFAVKSVYAFSSNISHCVIVESIYFIYVE